MQIPIRQRLVGAAVLVALAVIFLPMIFDGAGRRPAEIDGPVIPPEPGFEAGVILPATVPPPATRQQAQREEPVGEVATEGTAEAAAAPPPERREAVAAPLPEPDPSPAPASPPPRPATVAWVVQTGSFSDESNAVAESDRLREAGYPAFVEPYESGARTMYRVKVGPELQRRNAEELAARLTGEEGVEGMVLSHP